jgi:hypothetical protein
MSQHTIIYERIISAYGLHTETIELSTGYAERIVRISAGRAARISIVCTGVDLAGSLCIEIRAEHPESYVTVGIACTIRGASTCVITTLQHHTAIHTTSRLHVRKVIYDQAVAVYRGMIHIAENARGCAVSQNDKTLFDGVSARAESVPAIEVLTDDVSCGHGSALGRIDEHTLWYMQSRGLSYAQAAQMYYAAFLDEVQSMVFE